MRRVVAPTKVEVTGVTLDPTTVSVEAGKTVKVTATVTPADATDKTVTYSVDDDTIATVTADGTITGVKDGIATVTATAGGKTATTAVTVTAAA
ncbi:Ig domain-containing protein [Levilactobacillus acidifarinae]